MKAAKDDFVPHRHCTVASGDCFTEGRCLAQCGAWKEKDHEARIKRLEQDMAELRRRLAAPQKGSEMAEKMSLQQVRDAISECAEGRSMSPMRGDMKRWADAIDAHLTQPAQAVDVGAIREVAEALRTNASDVERNGLSNLALHLRNCAAKITAAQQAAR